MSPALDATAKRALGAWAQLVGTPPEALTESGVTVVPRPDDRLAIGWLQAEGTVVTVPPQLASDVQELGDEAADIEALVDALGERVVSTTGPAAMGWLRDDWQPALDPERVRRLVLDIEPSDHRLSAFHGRLPPTDQDSWMVNADHGHAVIRGGRVIAAAMSETVGGTLAHFGVATATDHRLEGHALTVTTAACLAAHERGTVPQYRTARRNSGGLRVAASAGFELYCTQALVHLRRKG